MSKDVKKEQAVKTPFVDLVANYPFHNFEVEPKFMGEFINTVTLGEDEENRFQANIFSDVETGELFYLSNAYSIDKAIKAAKEKYNTLQGLIFRIEFLGKTEIKGKPFNQFKIGTCTLEQYEAFFKSE
jgi:hypothetical protein